MLKKKVIFRLDRVITTTITMKINLTFINRSFITIASAVAFGLILLKEHLTDGIATHYILHNKDLPGFSNMWGLITIPAVTWLALILIEKNSLKASSKNTEIRFLVALLFGISMCLAWFFDLENLMSYSMIGIIVLSVFLKMNRADLYLGYVLGMMYTFGAVLPIIIATVLFIIFTLTNAIRIGVLLLFKKA